MKIRQVSASQVNSHRRCRRKWYLRYVDKIRKPQTEAQARGSMLHKHQENYLKEGKLPTDPLHRPYVEAAIEAVRKDGSPVLPHPQGYGETHLVEHRFLMDTHPSLPKWLGFIDLLSVEPAEIGDLKTTSNLRYAKTPSELLSDTQMMSYAKFAYSEGHEGPLTLWHLYIEAKAKAGVLTPPKTKLPRTKFVPITVDQEHVEDCWQKELDEVNEMTKTALLVSHQDVTPNTSACGDYGGCEYQQECGIAGFSLSFQTQKQQKQEQVVAMSSVLARLKAKSKAKAAGDNAGDNAGDATSEPGTKKPTARAKPDFLKKRLAAKKAAKAAEVEAEVPTGIVPPDAPERTTPVEVKDEAEGETEEKPKKKRKPRSDKGKPRKTKSKAKAEASEADEKTEAKVEKKKSNGVATASAEGFELYIDCALMKATDSDDQAVMFEDWAAPIIAELNESLGDDVHDYHQLKYDERMAAVVMAFAAHLGDVPPVLIVNSSALAAREALNVLIPHARRVTRAIGR